MWNNRSFLTEESGPTTPEYAVLLAVVILICVTGIVALGQKISQIVSDLTEYC